MCRKIEHIFTKDLLEEEYHKNNLTTRQIGNKYNVSAEYIRKRMVKHNVCRNPPNRKISRIFKIGDIVGELTIIERDENFINKNGKKPKYICKCSCGNISSIFTHIIHKRQKCRKCLIKTLDKYTKYEGYKYITGTIFNNIVSAARQRSLEVCVTPQFLYNLFENQFGICALTGVDIFISNNPNKVRSTASLDRIDSNQNYTENNVQWVHKVVNRIKGSLAEDNLLDWAEKLVANKRLKQRMCKWTKNFTYVVDWCSTPQICS